VIVDWVSTVRQSPTVRLSVMDFAASTVMPRTNRRCDGTHYMCYVFPLVETSRPVVDLRTYCGRCHETANARLVQVLAAMLLS
jgi:hypothetical protein